MRTNIVLDDKLVADALELSDVTTKKDLVHRALSEYVANHSQRNLQKLRGKIRFRKGYDHKALRRSRTA